MSVKLRAQLNYKKPIPESKKDRVLLSTSFYIDVNYHNRRQRRFFPGGAMMESWSKDVKKKFKETKVDPWFNDQLLAVVHDEAGLPVQFEQHVYVLPELETYLDEYTGKDRLVVRGIRKHLKKYLTPKTQFAQIDEDYLQGFIDFMDEDGLSGVSVGIYWQKFRDFLYACHKTKKCKYNPRLAQLSLPKIDSPTKDPLSLAEVAIIAAYPCQDQRVKLFFLFQCYTGLSFSDVYYLKPEHISNGCLVKQRNKLIREKDAKKRRKKEIPAINLHPQALAIIKMAAPSDDGYIFDLDRRQFGKQAAYVAFSKIVKTWVKAAGVNKHITSHCARHTWKTNVKADREVNNFLTHHSRNSKAAETYYHPTEEKILEALSSIPMIEIKN